MVLIIGSLIGIFTLVRDISFPTGFVLISITSLGILVPLLPLPIALGAGYILGPRASFSWLAGAIFGWFILTPILVTSGITPDLTSSYMKNLGMGMVMGSGISFLISYILPRFRQIFLPFITAESKYRILLIGALSVGLISLIINDVPVLASVLTLLGIWAMVAVAARMTGETNIDPLEQFGIFIALLIAGIYALFLLPLPFHVLLIIAMTVSIACAIAGDAGHDYKSAAILHTKFSDIIKIDIITVVVTGFAAPFVFDIFIRAFSSDLFTPVMPAPQAQLVADSLKGFEHPTVFLCGFGLAFTGEIIDRFLPDKFQKRLLWMPFGIGLFLGPGLAIPIALGAVIHVWINKKNKEHYHTGILIAAGIMGAEGIAGFSTGALTIFGIDLGFSALILGLIFALVMVTGVWIYRQSNAHLP